MVSLLAGTFRQLAWVTNNFDQALAMFAADYGIVDWLQLRSYVMQTGPDQQARAHIALARRGGVEYEIIQPLGGADQVYRQVLTGGDTMQIVFHHLCYLLPTSEALEEVRHAASARSRPIVLQGSTATGATYFYTDERATLGHHIEYVHYPIADIEQLRQAIPENGALTI